MFDWGGDGYVELEWALSAELLALPADPAGLLAADLRPDEVGVSSRYFVLRLSERRRHGV